MAEICCVTENGSACGKPAATAMDEPGGGMHIPMCEEHGRDIGFVSEEEGNG